MCTTLCCSRAFLDQWQEERGMLEGDSHLDEVEEILYADTARTQMFRVLRLLCLQSLTAGGTVEIGDVVCLVTVLVLCAIQLVPVWPRLNYDATTVLRSCVPAFRHNMVYSSPHIIRIRFAGIRATRYDGLRRAIVQTYGYQHAFTMSNLEKAGALSCVDFGISTGCKWLLSVECVVHWLVALGVMRPAHCQ